MNEELKAAREKSGKTQAQVAEEANIGERSYQDYEYDKREPGVRTAIRIICFKSNRNARRQPGESKTICKSKIPQSGFTVNREREGGAD